MRIQRSVVCCGNGRRCITSRLQYDPTRRKSIIGEVGFLNAINLKTINQPEAVFSLHRVIFGNRLSIRTGYRPRRRIPVLIRGTGYPFRPPQRVRLTHLNRVRFCPGHFLECISIQIRLRQSVDVQTLRCGYALKNVKFFGTARIGLNHGGHLRIHHACFL
ncbi:hypothetical protein D3C76_1299700 [compost metagenome]